MYVHVSVHAHTNTRVCLLRNSPCSHLQSGVPEGSVWGGGWRQQDVDGAHVQMSASPQASHRWGESRGRDRNPFPKRKGRCAQGIQVIMKLELTKAGGRQGRRVGEAVIWDAPGNQSRHPSTGADRCWRCTRDTFWETVGSYPRPWGGSSLCFCVTRVILGGRWCDWQQDRFSGPQVPLWWNGGNSSYLPPLGKNRDTICRPLPSGTHSWCQIYDTIVTSSPSSRDEVVMRPPVKAVPVSASVWLPTPWSPASVHVASEKINEP